MLAKLVLYYDRINLGTITIVGLYSSFRFAAHVLKFNCFVTLINLQIKRFTNHESFSPVDGHAVIAAARHHGTYQLTLKRMLRRSLVSDPQRVNI